MPEKKTDFDPLVTPVSLTSFRPSVVLPVVIGINNDHPVRKAVRLDIRKNGPMTDPEVVYLQSGTSTRSQKFIDLGCGLGVHIEALPNRVQIVISRSAGVGVAAMTKAA